MRRYEVSSRVNLVKNNDAACAEPVVREGAEGVHKPDRNHLRPPVGQHPCTTLLACGENAVIVSGQTEAMTAFTPLIAFTVTCKAVARPLPTSGIASSSRS